MYHFKEVKKEVIWNNKKEEKEKTKWKNKKSAKDVVKQMFACMSRIISIRIPE
jgi:hypothetical protein